MASVPSSRASWRPVRRGTSSTLPPWQQSLALGRLGPYTVAKHGVLGLSDVLRAEFETLEAPVGVSVVMPGMVKTAMNPIGTVPPAVVAANVVDAIRHGRRYVFTDDHSAHDVEDRFHAILAARGDVIS